MSVKSLREGLALLTLHTLVFPILLTATTRLQRRGDFRFVSKGRQG